MVEQWLDSAAEWSVPVLALIAFAMAYGETALFTDFVVPGEVAMAFLGAAVAEGDSGPGAVVALAVVGGVGALLGDFTSHLVGRTAGQRLMERWDWLRRRLGEPVQRARHVFGRRGGAAVIAARLIGPLRAAVPFVAGLSGWPLRRLAPWSAAASVVWPAYVLVLGAVFGRSAAQVIDRAGWAMFGVLALIVGVTWIRRRRLRARRGPTHL